MSDEARRREERGDTYPDGSSRYQDEAEDAMGPDEGINWKQMCEDNADLLKRALGRERSLAERGKVKDEAHRKDIVILQAEITRLEQARAEIAQGQGTVPRDMYEAALAKLAKATGKLDATRKYAEEQRLAAGKVEQPRRRSGSGKQRGSPPSWRRCRLRVSLSSGDLILSRPRPCARRRQVEGDPQSVDRVPEDEGDEEGGEAMDDWPLWIQIALGTSIGVSIGVAVGHLYLHLGHLGHRDLHLAHRNQAMIAAVVRVRRSRCAAARSGGHRVLAPGCSPCR